MEVRVGGKSGGKKWRLELEVRGRLELEVRVGG